MKPVNDERPPGHAAILRVIGAIPKGCVASYGEIAARAGLPRRARLVGQVLRTAPSDGTLPWHRVIRADGRIAFARGSDSHREQLRRLAREGVRPVGDRFDLVGHGWQPGANLDAELWGPAPRVRASHAAQ